MKNFVLVFLLAFLSQTLAATTIEPSVDTIPFKKWKLGVQVSDLSFGKFNSSFGLGLFAERRMSDRFGIESEFTFFKTYYRPFSERGEGWGTSHLRLSLSGKYYFGENRRWFAKAGIRSDYFLSTGYFDKINEGRTSNLIGWDELNTDRFTLNPFLGIGYELPLNNGGALKFEFDMFLKPNDANRGMNLKVGYRF